MCIRDSVETLIFPLPCSQALKEEFLCLFECLRDKVTGLNVAYQSREADRWQQEDGSLVKSRRVTWGHLIELEGVVAKVERLCASEVLEKWKQGDCPNLTLYYFDGNQFRRKATSELYEEANDWSKFERDFVSSGILARETEVVDSLQRLERRLSSFRALRRRANRIGPRPFSLFARRVPQGS